MYRAQNADIHALKQPRLSQNISPVCSSFVLVIASDMHLESESEKPAKNVDFHTAKKKNPDTINTFSLFSHEFLEIDLRPIYCSLTTTAAFPSAPNDLRHWQRGWAGLIDDEKQIDTKEFVSGKGYVWLERGVSIGNVRPSGLGTNVSGWGSCWRSSAFVFTRLPGERYRRRLRSLLLLRPLSLYVWRLGAAGASAIFSCWRSCLRQGR